MNGMNPEGAHVQIRRMDRADLDRVTEIAQSLKEAPHWPRAAYLAALDSKETPLRIALVAVDTSPRPELNPEMGAVVGFAVASLSPPQAELEVIAVAVEGQRRGVGRRLFAALVEELGGGEVTEVIWGLMLEVRASNQPALGLYRSLGFQESGRRPRYYADPVEDAVLMRRDIQAG